MAHFAGTWFLPVFFALIGIELKHEIREGTFRNKRDLAIPFTAATLGVLTPFVIYMTFESFLDIPRDGWGVVVATDLPFALLALRLFKSKFAQKIRPYLLSLAIFDDLLSIIIIAFVFNKNGIHPTVYGFIFGLLIPINIASQTFKRLTQLTNFLILPLFIIATLLENFAIEIGWITFTVVVARIIGKPIGILIGDLIARKIMKSKILDFNEVLGVGILGSLGLSVSLLFAEISNASTVVVASVFVTLPLALISIIFLRKILER